MNFAPAAAKRTSHISACTSPSPAAAPLIAQITGFGIVVAYVCGRVAAELELADTPSSATCESSSMSAQTQKLRPAPVTTIARTSGSAAQRSSAPK